MDKKLNMDEWEEITIRTPGTFANPREMNAIIRELFCHDSVLDHQRQITEGGMREAVGMLRQVARRKLGDGTKASKIALDVIEEVLNSFDPESGDWSGPYPAVMLCSEHEVPAGIQRGSRVTFSACPGVPYCRAHEGVRVR